MRIQHGIDNVYQMIEGHRKCLDNNTGLTVSPASQNFLVDPEHLIANGWKGSTISNDWTTPEAQAVLIMGYVEVYKATEDEFWLDRAKACWDAFDKYLTGNFAVEGKCNRISHYPLADDGIPQHGGFKGVSISFNNGRAKIPSGSPNWGEYLDIAIMAYDGALGCNSMNSDVYAGTDDVPDWYASGTKYLVDWYIAWDGNRYWANGKVADTGHAASEYGTVQLADTSVNGTHKLNYAVRLPVAQGGKEINHYDPVITYPCNVTAPDQPVPVDALAMWCDASYALYSITYKSKYFEAYNKAHSELLAYCNPNAYDMIYRRTTAMRAPFTDGNVTIIGNKPALSRDAEGYINVGMGARKPCEIVQHGLTYKVNKDSSAVIEFGGENVLFQPYFTIDDGYGKNIEYRVGVPFGGTSVQANSFEIRDFVRVSPEFGESYLLPKEERLTASGGAVLGMGYSSTLLGHSDNYASLDLSSGQVVFDFNGTRALRSITYQCTADIVRINFLDKDGWLWYTDLQGTGANWVTENLSIGDFRLEPTQPNHTTDEVKPFFANLKEVTQIILKLATTKIGDGIFNLYCVNNLPEFCNFAGDIYIVRFSMHLSSRVAATAKLGDCCVTNYKFDSLNYAPGAWPSGKVANPDGYLLEEKPTYPVAGEQYPAVFCMGEEPTDLAELTNCVKFLFDAQQQYAIVLGTEGPVYTAYNWQKGSLIGGFMMLDNSKMQSRAFLAGCRALYELKKNKKPVDERLEQYCQKWIAFLNRFQSANSGRLPTDFNTTGGYSNQDRGDRQWITAEWLAGCCYAGLAGYTWAQIDPVVEACMNNLQKHYSVNGTNILNGCWANSDPVGFHSGEILRGLGLYAQYRNLYI